MKTTLAFTTAMLVVLLALVSPQNCVAVLVDGSLVGDNYGPPISVQTVQTEFGDHNGVDKGSELNAAYARVESGQLFLTLTGNLEDNFNKLILFFDSQPGGQNVLDTDTANGGVNPVFDPSPFSPDPGMFEKMTNGGPTTFDTGFTADFVLVIRHGFTGTENRMDVDFGILGGTSSQYLGVLDPTVDLNGTTGTGANASPIEVGFNNSNIGGIGTGTGTADQAAAELVATGIELGIDLADLGNPAFGDEILITAFLSNSNYDYVSNQFLGGLPAGTENLGSDGIAPPIFLPGETFFDLNTFAGDQFFTITVVPESSTLLLGTLAIAGLLTSRQRKK